ncbi:MAG: helix-turn-helix domain-containing protein [Deltaproteobacteria bacterium]|jgi:DNA-binding transcriptional regulator PaaX|nr:helix-turn-helix domain-containing protein [Deltaproteobacteria bacterium]
MAMIGRDGFATAKTVAKELGLGATQGHNILKRMLLSGWLVSSRNGRRMEYRADPPQGKVAGR